jgi:hypothetical protein
MTTPVSGPPGAPPSWHDDALRLGAALDHVAAALVVGRDGEAAAWAALGAARAQSTRRRVAVADLVGDAAALADLGEGDEPVGISDSFFYGVTLNKIARPADEAGNLFVLPSGSEPVAVTEVLSSDRWRRLVAGFREAGALLVLAARADAPGLDALASHVDGLVVVGDLNGLLPDAPAPLMVIPSPTPRQARAAARAAAATPSAPQEAAHAAELTDRPDAAARAEPAGPAARVIADPDQAGPFAAAGAAAGAAAPTFADELARAAGPAPARRAPITPDERGDVPGRASTRRGANGARWAGVAAVAVLAAVAGGLLWSRRTVPVERAEPAAARPAVAAATTPPARDTAARRDSLPARSTDLAAALTLRNPADSARAAAYAVYLVSANTPEGAALPSGVDPALVPEPALTPQMEDGAPWWRLLVGAYATRERADSALVALRRSGAVGAGSGTVVRAPYALLVADRLPAAEAPRRVEALARRGVPTYPLSRGDGTVALYAGAFERPDDAAYLAQALQAAGVAPALVYRTGAPGGR